MVVQGAKVIAKVLHSSNLHVIYSKGWSPVDRRTIGYPAEKLERGSDGHRKSSNVDRMDIENET